MKEKLSQQALKLINFIPVFCHQNPSAAMEVFKVSTLEHCEEVREYMLENELLWLYNNESSYMIEDGYIEMFLDDPVIAPLICVDYPFEVFDQSEEGNKQMIFELLLKYNPAFMAGREITSSDILSEDAKELSGYILAHYHELSKDKELMQQLNKYIKD